MKRFFCALLAAMACVLCAGGVPALKQPERNPA